MAVKKHREFMYYYPDKGTSEDLPIHSDFSSKSDMADDYDAFKKDVKEEVKHGLEQIELVRKSTQESFDRQKISVIESLAVFVALFTFVSIEFQLFRSVNSWLTASAFTLLFLGGLLLFCGVVEKIMTWDDTPNRIEKFFRTKESWIIKAFKLLTTRTFVLILLPLILIIGGLILIITDQAIIGKINEVPLQAALEKIKSNIPSVVPTAGTSSAIPQ
jgi:hypothetical protein